MPKTRGSETNHSCPKVIHPLRFSGKVRPVSPLNVERTLPTRDPKHTWQMGIPSARLDLDIDEG